jgi:WD40 repeat protein
LTQAEASALSAERPFPGLRPFAFADHAFFFGREDQTFELYRRLDRSRFIAVVGSSGSGKSSLVRAGLQPLIAAETAGTGGRDWRWIELRPGDKPLASLATALSALAPESDDPDADAGRRERFAFTLGQSRLGVGEVIDAIGDLGGITPLLFVDQFEELFRYAVAGDRGQAASREEAIQFVQLLLQAARDPARPVHVLLTMRSDFIGDCARFHDLPEAVSASQFLVPSLTRDQREAVIRSPIRAAGATIEPALVERLLNDAGDEFDQLPVLQHCLQRLWEVSQRAAAGGSPHLQLSTYPTIGGIAEALSRHADEIMESLPGDALAVEQIFRALSEVDRDGRATRRALPFAQSVAETGIDEETLRRVIDRFRADDCSFFVPAPSAVPNLAPDTRIDVGHEALLRRWDKISAEAAAEVEQHEGGWLRQEEDDGRTYRALLALLEYGRTLPLDQVETRWAWWNERPRTAAWAARYGGQIERVQQLFDDSRAALTADRERHARAEHAERERLEERAAATRQLARRTRVAALAMGVLAIIATGFGIFGLIEAREARLQGDAAERAARVAESKTAEATAALNEARLNESRLLVGRAETEMRNGDPVLAGLLALAALPADMRNIDRPLWPPAVGILARARNLDRSRAILEGHPNWVMSAAWSPDGSRIVTASTDRTARIWNADTGATLAVLEGHTAIVRSAAWSPDGSRIVTASDDHTVRIWNADTGATLAVLEGHTAIVRSADWSPDGSRIVTTSDDKTARIWDAKTSELIAALQGHAGPVESAAWSPDGSRIVTASDDHTARIWEADTGATLTVFQGHRNLITSATWSPDGSRIVTASPDGAQIWDAKTGAPLAMLERPLVWFYSAAWSPDGARIVTASDDKTARIWDAETGTVLAVLEGHTDIVRSAAWSPDGSRIVTASYDNTARIWDAKPEPWLAMLKGHEDAVFGAAWSPDGARIVTASGDSTARIWDAKIGTELAVLEGHTATVRSAAWSPDGERIVTASWDDTARIWDAKTGAQLAVLEGHTAWLYSAAWSPDGSRIVTASDDKTARIWDAKTGAQLAVLEGHTATVRSAAWSPDGLRILTASSDNTARIWDAKTGAPLEMLQGHTGAINSASWSPDGSRIVTASDDKTARVWDAKTDAQLAVLEIGTEVVTAAWRPDGLRIVTASLDNIARIWDAKTGAILAVIEGHTDAINSVAWSPDGSRIVTASSDNTARVWDAWPLLTADTVTYAAVSGLRGLTTDERARLFLEMPKRAEPTQTVSATTVQDMTGMSVVQLRAAASAGNPYAHRRLAEMYERGETVEVSLERALFYHAVEARLFEAEGNEVEAQVAYARRGSDARALPLEVAVRIAHEAMDWRPLGAR